MITTENLTTLIKQGLTYLGLSNFEVYLTADYPESHIGIGTNIKVNPYKYVQGNLGPEEILKPLKESLANSPYIADIKRSYEQRIQTLEQKIETLEKQNMNLSRCIEDSSMSLSEAFTNGAELLNLEN